jgi:hemerythrin-like domain-containing protein
MSHPPPAVTPEERPISQEDTARIARIRSEHQVLRRKLVDFADAVDGLALRGETEGAAALVSLLRAECDQHFPIEEELAIRLLGASSKPVLLLLSEHRDLRARTERVEQLVERARRGDTTSHDELGGEMLQLGKALTCHLCREENGLLPMIETLPLGSAPPYPWFVLGFTSEEVVTAEQDSRLAAECVQAWQRAGGPPGFEVLRAPGDTQHIVRWFVGPVAARLLDEHRVGWRPFLVGQCQAPPEGAAPVLRLEGQGGIPR